MKINRIGLGAVALAAVGALTLAGCSSDAGNKPSTSSSDGIVKTNGSEPENPLIPAGTNETGGGHIVDSIFAGLVYYDVKGDVVNDVAKSIESDDATNFTITLNDDRTFTNGEKVTAKSFVDAWNYSANLDNALNNRNFFEDIDGYSEDTASELTGLNVVSDTEFTVKLKAPTSDFAQRLGYTAFAPLPSVAYEDIEKYGQNPIGNGPYKFASDTAWTHNERVLLVANEDYNGGRKAQNKGLTFEFYDTLDSAYADLQGGNLDVIDMVPDSALKTFESDLDGRAVTQESATFQSFTIPERLEHFSGEEGILRRQAISHAIDREQITDVIFNKTRTPAKDFSSPVIPGYTADVPGNEVLKFDPTKAKELWAQADAIAPWTGTFKLGYNANGDHAGWVDALTNQLKTNLGIEAEGEPTAVFADFRQLITSHTIQTAFRTGWQADYPSISNYLLPLYTTGAGSNDGEYSNPEFDALVRSGLEDLDQKSAEKKFTEAQSVLFKDLPALPLWNATASGGWGADVENVQFAWNSVPVYFAIEKK
ncbi:peptide ABC transporter substrate-binding protein [Mycetocola spongiae]|uniref:peptide ABC transporter substrate-binding protein n=1 Tax=Mycetocola spongiae TaxID=2859226 RepID=UPI001CF31456|nr:ABC transporter substrate-binding protein [Mycetocola spongiae]UCR89021.1 ABC transporter substrate-binding protein [Mycetocola spongiae]